MGNFLREENLLKFKKTLLGSARFLFEKLIRPKSRNEDSARREFILNILLLGIIILYGVGFMGAIFKKSTNPDEYTGFSLLLFGIIFGFFIAIYLLSRFGLAKISSYLFISFFFLLVGYANYYWGTDLPAVLIFYSLVIVMASILISSRLAFVFLIAISLLMYVISYLQTKNLIFFNDSWKDKSLNNGDMIIYIIILSIITIISWLSNREIKKSLKRARRSEKALRKEKASLERRVEERTRELREAQMKQMSQLYRFSELGKISAGLFHDLINPLTALSLNIQKLKEDNSNSFSEAKFYLDRAVSTTKRIEGFVLAVKKQISQKEIKRKFSLNKEISQVIEILSYKIRKFEIEVDFLSDEKISIIGNPVKFSQVMANLISNAIDSYRDMKIDIADKKIIMRLTRDNGDVVISVKDSGIGISKENLKNIFNPFFSTKNYKDGIGIGLAIVKGIIEKDFKGKIFVESSTSSGTKFTIKIPSLP